MKVLVVSSNAVERSALAAPFLAPAGVCAQLSTVVEALSCVPELLPDAVVLDGRGLGQEALTFLRRLRSADVGAHLPVALILGPHDQDATLMALRLGADDVLVDGFRAEELFARVQRSVAFKRRVDGLVAARQESERLSVTDGLTQLYNQRHFRDRLQVEWRRVQRYQDPLGVLFVDLDFFKDVNDRYGHLMGDKVLKVAAAAIRACLRDVDFAARYGGEEFAVLLPATDLEGAAAVGERVRQNIRRLRFDAHPRLRLTASVGVAALPHPDLPTPEQLVGAADDALYRAKHEGRDRVATFTPPRPTVTARSVPPALVTRLRSSRPSFVTPGGS
jgi:diguanylate cyclase (GGDEF)-like protein